MQSLTKHNIDLLGKSVFLVAFGRVDSATQLVLGLFLFSFFFLNKILIPLNVQKSTKYREI